MDIITATECSQSYVRWEQEVGEGFDRAIKEGSDRILKPIIDRLIQQNKDSNMKPTDGY
jgi:hypothetical protein